MIGAKITMTSLEASKPMMEPSNALTPERLGVTIPEGWEWVPPGVKVMFRANRLWIDGINGQTKPFKLVIDGVKELFVEEIEVIGKSKSFYRLGELWSHAWFETQSGVLYKP